MSCATLAKAAPKAAAASGEGVEEGDEAGAGEEDFEAGMRQNAMERDAADADNDGKLDFAEFCVFVRDREAGEFTDEELKGRFDALDDDGSGKIDMAEYLQWSLKDALMRSSSRVVDLFRMWDEDRSGTVDKGEFHKAVRALGFDVQREDTDAVFESLDDDKSGNLEYKELNEMLRKGVGAERAKANLKRAPRQADRSRGAKVSAKETNVNYMTSRAAALPPMVKLDASGEVTIEEQLFEILKEHQVKLIDLFREWDDDGNGALDKKELRKSIAALGYDAPKKDIDAFFDSVDTDKSGWIEYHELKAALTKVAREVAKKAPPLAKKAPAPKPPASRPPDSRTPRSGEGFAPTTTDLSDPSSMPAMLATSSGANATYPAFAEQLSPLQAALISSRRTLNSDGSWVRAMQSRTDSAQRRSQIGLRAPPMRLASLLHKVFSQRVSLFCGSLVSFLER